MAEDTKAPDDKAAQQDQPEPDTSSNKSAGDSSSTDTAGASPPEPETRAEEEPAVLSGRASTRPSAPPLGEPVGAAWGIPLKKFYDRWTKLETYLCVLVVIAEIFALVSWVLLKGLGTPHSAGTPTGTIVRAVVGATVLGLVSYFATRKQSIVVQRIANSAAILVGLFGAGLWTGVGVGYFANILNWLQDASALTLVGGLRGLGTRLTIWLAMLGGSLAAASGKHIHIDVVMRFVPRKARVGATLVTWIGAAVVCFTAAWGFVDHIAIESYDVDRTASAGEKFSAIAHHTNEGFFILRKQIALDLSTLPRVIAGTRHDEWLTNDEWNRRIQDAGYEDHFTPEQVASLKMTAESGKEFRLPVVQVPGSTHQGLLKHLLNLVFPFGFMIIGVRFLLRGVLALSGHVNVDPDALHVHGAPTTAAEAGKQGAA